MKTAHRGALLSLAVALCGCCEDGPDAVRAWMREARPEAAKPRLEPLPQMAAATPVARLATGARGNPFSAANVSDEKRR